MQDSTAAPASDRLFASLVGLGYLVGGLLWIGFSDQAGKLLFSSPAALTRFQTWKGAGFVLASALLVFLLARRASRHGALRPGARTQVRLSALLLGLVLVTAVPLATMLGYNVWRQARSNAQEPEPWRKASPRPPRPARWRTWRTASNWRGGSASAAAQVTRRRLGPPAARCWRRSRRCSTTSSTCWCWTPKAARSAPPKARWACR